MAKNKLKRFEVLSAKEGWITLYTGRGWTTDEIGEYFGISSKTAQTYRQRSAAKLNADSREYRKLAYEYAVLHE